MDKAIIIGASSGIGRELANILSKEKYTLGLMARRSELLFELQRELPTKSYVKNIDISKPDEAMSKLTELIHEMNGVDLIIITSGIGNLNNELNWNEEKETIDVNVTGVTAIINISLKHFMEKNYGQLVVISSIACLRGDKEAPAYSASKAYISNYLDGIRCKVKKNKNNITITDVRPGLVDTDMAKGEGLFWVQSPQKVACQIHKKIKQKKKIVYVTKRWAVIAIILRYMPDWIYHRL